MTSERTPTEVSKAIEHLRGELEVRNIHPSRIGKSALQGVDITLRVYFANEPPVETRAAIPTEIDAFPVTITVTGEITAQ